MRRIVLLITCATALAAPVAYAAESKRARGLIAQLQRQKHALIAALRPETPAETAEAAAPEPARETRYVTVAEAEHEAFRNPAQADR